MQKVPYSPVFTGMPLYTKPPIFKNGQMVSYITNIIRGLRHVALYETFKETLPDLVPIKNTSESATGPLLSVSYHACLL